ncbi:MAG: serine/threonine protein kinase [Phycisphaerales bacterium]|nr:serine/threonine protein kinase [Phycisphaerales bacterium]
MSLWPNGSSLVSASVDLPRSLFGYDIIEHIGTGAGSTIYAGTDPNTKQILAIKHVLRKTDRDVRFISQLESEYEVGKQVNHSGLRRSFDYKVERMLLRKITEAIVVMELVDGMPLDMNLPADMLGMVSCFIQTAQALDSLHGLGFVHCDLKPNNILINHSGQVKVIDLGQACKIGTAKQRIQGTPDYIAPEQVKCQPVTVRTDIFNLGATMYWSLTGQKLPTLFTLKKTENSFLVDGQMSSPRSINPKVPENLSNLVMDCVRTIPSKRPQEMSEVIRRLETIHHATNRDNLIRSAAE